MQADTTPPLKNITLMLFDVDGTLTDGTLLFDGGGNEWKSFSARDGSRMTLALKAGIKIFFITSRVSPSVSARAKERGIHGVLSKGDFKDGSLASFFTSQGVAKEHVLYLGDDLNDLPFLREAGVAAAVSDACDEVKAVAHVVTEKGGGKGAAAEIIEAILRAKGIWEETITSLY